MGTTLVALLARRRNPNPSPRAWDYTVLIAPAATRPGIARLGRGARPLGAFAHPRPWLDQAIPCAIRPESRSALPDSISITSYKYAIYDI